MVQSVISLTGRQARMLAIRAQGFRQLDLQRSANGGALAGWRQMKSSLLTMGALQIDAINTVIRSHYTPLYSRLGPYDRATLDKHLFTPRKKPGQCAFFEYWGHECSVLPLEFYPLFRWRMNDAKKGVGIYKQLHQLAEEKPAFVASVKQQLQCNPMSCRELGPDRRGPGMWEWSESKQALEYLFSTGEIASAGRRGFERVYCLAEEIVPEGLLDHPEHERIDAQSALMEFAASALGVATEADLRDYFRLSAVDGKAALVQLVTQGRVVETTVEGWSKPAFIIPNRPIPRQAPVSTLLTPFDPLVWNRDRAKRLFGFDYKIEIYVPQDKRRFGYWVMPFLHNGNIVARIDLKADRDADCLQVKGAWSEPHQNTSDITTALHQELNRLAAWLGLSHCSIGNKGDLTKQLRKSA